MATLFAAPSDQSEPVIGAPDGVNQRMVSGWTGKVRRRSTGCRCRSAIRFAVKSRRSVSIDDQSHHAISLSWQ